MTASKEALRAQAPEMAAFVDDMRSEFGDVRVVYLCIGGSIIGKPVEGRAFPADPYRLAEEALSNKPGDCAYD